MMWPSVYVRPALLASATLKSTRPVRQLLWIRSEPVRKQEICAGRNIGLRNDVSMDSSPVPISSVAKSRINASTAHAAVCMPCEITVRNPNARASSGCRWIGLISPFSELYSRGAEAGTLMVSMTCVLVDAAPVEAEEEEFCVGRVAEARRRARGNAKVATLVHTASTPGAAYASTRMSNSTPPLCVVRSSGSSVALKVKDSSARSVLACTMELRACTDPTGLTGNLGWVISCSCRRNTSAFKYVGGKLPPCMPPSSVRGECEPARHRHILRNFSRWARLIATGSTTEHLSSGKLVMSSGSDLGLVSIAITAPRYDGTREENPGLDTSTSRLSFPL
mmetsp:Transcript_43910/g.83854  ORF Transcript_43910/g.83854 Transcript_43910/m.83854 type:complete len:336 (+) Transcript_43910:357-1364(+)